MPGRLTVLISRVRWLDLLTAVALIVAGYLFVRPGSVLHASVSRWSEARATSVAAKRQWDRLAEVAMPLYEGTTPPEVIEFLDYECPFCRASKAAVDSAVAAGARISVVHLPLFIHARARPAALVAICARELGQFRLAHGVLLGSDEWVTDDDWAMLPELSTLYEQSAFSRCLLDGRAEAVLGRHVALAESLRVAATPVFVSRRGVLNEVPTLRSLVTFAADGQR